MALVTENESAIEEEISNIVVELYDNIALLQNNNDLAEIHNIIDNYIKRVTRIGFRLAKSKYTALRDSCVIFHGILEDLKKQGKPLSPEQTQQFEVWPTLILSYLSQPGEAENIENILGFLQDPTWNYQAEQDDFEHLKQAFYKNTAAATEDGLQEEVVSEQQKASPALTPADDETEEEDIYADASGAFDGAVFDSIQEEILDAMTSLISDLSFTDDDDEFGLSHAFNLCADRIELLGMSIATAGLMGLMDVCMLFQSGLRTLANREKPLTDDERIIIEEWTSHLIAYLSSPTDDEIVDHLVDYMNNIPWAEPMSEEEVMTLRLMLIPEDIVLEAPEDDLLDLSEDIVKDDISETIQTQDEVKEDELVYELDDQDGLDEISVSEDSYVLGQELIQLIHDEIQLEQPSLDNEIQQVQSNTDLNESDIEHLTQYNSMIERFALATDSIGLSGLNKVLSEISIQLKVIINEPDNYQLSDEIVNYLRGFSTNTLNYLDDMENSEIIDQLISPLFIPSWPTSTELDKEVLAKELLSPQLVIEEDIEIRATQATTDDVSLKLPEDVNQQLLSTLLQELPIQTEEFTQSITRLVEGNASLKDVEKAQRIAHTLKGAANTVGVVGIATLTHHIEDIFDVFTNNNRLPGKNLADILMNAADVLEMMSESLLGLGEAPENAQSVLQQILDWANLIDQEGIPEDDAQIQVTSTEPETVEAEKDDTSHLNEVAAPTMLRVPASLMDDLLRIAGESIILGGQLQERLRKATEQTQLVHEQNVLYQQLVFELEQIVDVQGLTANKQDSNSDEVFDSLELEQYNELHTVTHRLVEAATDSKELTHSIEDELHNLETLMVDQSRLHKENQNIVMQTRMVPVQNIVPRLQRSIRQTSRTTSKNVSLNVEGSETLMDSDVLDDLIDPIMHVLRNAIDHGIEPESIREEKGKSPAGNINLSFFRDGDHVVVRCVDDGAGLDFESIRKTAIKKNFITEDQQLSDDELTRLIWLAGFTTRDTTTQVSGRGIGMDAVYNQIAAMKGTISIESEKDKGCTVELRLPLTLISVHAILVKLRRQTIAVSNRGISQILTPGDGKLKRTDTNYTYTLNDEVYDTFDIETLLHQPRDQRNADRDERSVLIVNDETGRQYAVTVEQITANQDLIVKQLGSYIPDIIGIEGATILGDGSVAPVLDIPGLIRTAASYDISPLIEQRLAEAEAEKIKDNLVALVVDDSLSARRSLAEFVKDIGYDVRMARDGIEALEVIEKKKPDIILVDLEMPRMNGLELTSHVRSKSDTKDIPIIMITSRSTEKHREMADTAGVNNYLTKPFSEDELLENIQNLLLAVN